MRFPQLPGRFGDCSVCFDPTGLSYAAIAAALAGTAVTTVAGQQAASASRSAQDRASAVQQAQFNARMEAQREQLASQSSINTAAAQRFSENQAVTQNAQSDALNQRGETLKALNQQQAITANQADQAVKQGVDATTATKLAAAQQEQVAQQQAMNTPVVAQAAASNPLGASGTNSTVTKQAMDTANQGAAGFVKQYGDSQAQLSGYNAPIALATDTAKTIGTNLMPAGVADQLVRTGAPAILNPSTTAYQQAGTYGQAVQEANRLTAAGATGIANTRVQSSTDIANLRQQDETTALQNELVRAQQSAAQLSGLGSGLSALGNTGLMIGASQGGLRSLLPATGPGSFRLGPGPGAM